MYYVYILKDKLGKLYTGYSSNLKSRISEHEAGMVYTTSRMCEPKLVYYEAYDDKSLAQDREKKLKKYGSSYIGLLKRLKIK